MVASISGFSVKNIWRLGVLAGLMLTLAFGIAACQPQALKTEAAQVPQIVDSMLSDPKTFNPVLSNESPSPVSLIYEGLITENGLTGETEPALAEKWEVSPDQKTITFTLRPNLKWSDGQPLTIADVLFTFRDLYLNPKIPSDTQDVLRIGKQRRFPTVTQLDDRRVAFTTPEPFAPFLKSMGLAILPKHVLAETVNKIGPDGNPLFMSTWGTDTDPKKIIGNGPYRLDGYATSQRIIFQRNPYYWRQDAQGTPQPYIERIVWSIVENQNTQLLQFRSGGLDMTEPIRAEDYPILKRGEERGKYTTYIGGPRPITTFMAFNLNQGSRKGRPLVDPIKSKWFNTVAFRQAVAYAIDREKMNTNIFRGLGVLVNSPILPLSPYYLKPEQGLKAYNYDPQKAKKLLTEAGFKYNRRGQLLDATGRRVRFSLMTNAGNTFREAMITQIKQDLSQIGIQVDLNPINFNALLDKLDNSLDWDAYLLAMGGGREPHFGTNVWLPDSTSHSFNQPAKPGQPPIVGRVVADWEAEIGRLYIEGSQELDETKRKAIYGRTQGLSQENLPWIPLVNARMMAVVRDRIQGVRYPDSGGALWNLHELRVVN